MSAGAAGSGAPPGLPREAAVRPLDLRLLPSALACAAVAAWVVRGEPGLVSGADPAAASLPAGMVAGLVLAGSLLTVLLVAVPLFRAHRRRARSRTLPSALWTSGLDPRPSRTRRALPRGGAGALLALVCAGAVLGTAHVTGSAAVFRDLAHAREQQSTVRALVRLDSAPVRREGRFGTTASASGRLLAVASGRTPAKGAVAQEAAVSTGQVRVRLRWTGSGPRAAAGQVMRVVATVDAESLSPVLTVGAAQALPEEQTAGGGGSGLRRLAQGLRERASESATALLPPNTAALVLGMSYGDDSGLDEEAQQNLRTAGLTHLTAVSGSNVAIVFLLGVHLVRWTRCPRALTVLVGLAAVGGFVVLVGPEASILRAAVMGTIGAVALVLGRGGSGGGALWAAVAVLLLMDPGMVAELGFLLSVAATCGILVSGPAVARVLARLRPAGGGGWLVEALSMTLVAGLWCTPLLVSVAGFLSPYTVAANVLVAPVVPAVTVCGLVGVMAPVLGAVPLFGPHLVATGQVLGLGCASWGARWTQAVAGWCAGLPGARLETGSGAGAVLCSAAACLLLLVLFHRLDPSRGLRMDQLPAHLLLSLDRPERVGVDRIGSLPGGRAPSAAQRLQASRDETQE